MEDRERTTENEDIALHPQLRENAEVMLHALLQATDYGILLTSLERQDLVANRRMGELFRMVPQEVVEGTPEEVRIRAQSLLRNPQTFEEQLKQTYTDPWRHYEDELELIGEPPRTLRRSTAPVLDLAGQPIARLWTFLDITETKRLQEEVTTQLTARTADYQATAEVLQAMNGLCRLATQHLSEAQLVIAALDLVRCLMGHEAAAILLLEASGETLSGVLCPVDGETRPYTTPLKQERAFLEALGCSQRGEGNCLRLHRNYTGPLAKRMRCPSVRVAPLLEEGQPIGFIALGTRQPDPELDPYRAEHLNAVIDQVALTLTNHRLHTHLHTALESLRTTQQRMIEMEQLRATGTLAVSIAHDIRNILTTMQMELAAQPDLASEALCAQLNRFLALTHRLLAFAQPRVLETRPTDISEVIRRVVPLIAGQAHIHEVEIVCNLAEMVPPIAADASRLEHLLVNLCLNAIQAMAEDGGVLTLTARRRDAWIEITVEDTGVGIPSDVLPRIFDPFFTTRQNGMGLGLFSGKRIVEEHGGQINVTSRLGEGTCFAVWLPCLQE